ncbi:MAG: amidohydrolase family protein [Planctomycetaceae bacterium]
MAGRVALASRQCFSNRVALASRQCFSNVGSSVKISRRSLLADRVALASRQCFSKVGSDVKVSRRSLLAGAVAGGLSSLCRSALAETEAAPRQTRPTRAGYFDIHVHLTQEWFGRDKGPVTADLLLHWMDAHDIAQAAVLPLVSPEAFWYPITTDFVLRECREHADRLVPFCAIDPRTLATHLPEKQQVVDVLRRYVEAGARGFGEHKPRLPIDDPLSMKLYEACDEVGLPVLFHLDNQANIDKPGLPGLDRVLTTFPNLTLIGHGKGWWASIAGGLMQLDLHVGYPQGRIAPGGAIDALMDKHRNLYADLSSSGAHALLRDPEFGHAFLLRRADRLLFGTDFYDLEQKAFQQFELFQRHKVPDDVRASISSGNARRLLKLA